MSWTQIYVRHSVPNSNTPEVMKRVDESIIGFGCAFVSPPPENLPRIDDNGNYEIRCFSSPRSNMIQNLLVGRFNLKIIKVVDNK